MAPPALREDDYVALAELRYRIRCFLVFSETSAREAGIEPQQHQLMLALRGLPEGEAPTVRRIAERLQLQHNSTVELVNRAAENELVEKRPSERDRREILVGITAKGRRVLEKLAVSHKNELRRAAPALLSALTTIIEERT